MKETDSNTWLYDEDDEFFEEVPTNGDLESNADQTCLNEKTMLKIFNYKNRSCFSKFFCCIFCCECPCCIKTDPLNEKLYFIKLWKNLSKESVHKTNSSLPFQTVLNLYAHKNVSEDLKKVRLNPNLLLVKSGQRNDLEFYIPQLCNFDLFGGQEQVAQFFFFLCNACFASFFFAHRVYWFMRSFTAIDFAEKIEHDLKFLNSIYKSENTSKKNIITNLFVAGSNKYIDYLKENGLLIFYEDKVESIVSEKLTEKNVINFYNKIKKNKAIISNYSDKMYKQAIENINNPNLRKTSSGELIWNDSQINVSELFINNYSIYSKSEIDYAPIEEDTEILNENEIKTDENIINDMVIVDKKNNIDDINLLSFHSDICFFDDLCKIGMDLIGKDPSLFKKIIIQKLTEINKNLPANVYLPFLTKSTRNYIIVHIPVTEIKVFKTKERVPFMVVFEMIRLDEILHEIQKENKILEINNCNQIINNENINNNISDEEKIRMCKTDALPTIDEIIKTNDQSLDLKKKKSKDSSNSKKSNSEDEAQNIINQTDIELSKPISIFLIEEETKNKENEQNKKNNSSLGLEKKLSDLGQTKLNIDELQFTRRYSNKNIDNSPSNKLRHSLNNETKNNFDLNLDINGDLNNLTIDSNNINTNNLINTSSSEEKNINPLKISITTDDDVSSDLSEEDKKIPLLENSNINTNNKKYNIKKIFGEKLEHQKNRLQNNSPFKNFKTFHIFKAIIKAGEDLKQEQFATQLISEFREIFSSNKVDCWLSSYEVISTGENCGLVEMVTNSLSMDQIKQKTGLSLKNFYIQYFGREKSKKFQQAVNNFIKSLAGYSLVSYILQIKDRHNGNILIDSEGHLIHIDFGFMLSNAPGKGLKFEKAPFKITDEMLELLGGTNGENFKKYKKLLIQGYFAIYNNFEKIQKLAEFMFNGQGKFYPCFEQQENALTELKLRLVPRENMSKQQKIQYIVDLLRNSIDNWTTTCYDKFQYFVQGIFY